MTDMVYFAIPVDLLDDVLLDPDVCAHVRQTAQGACYCLLCGQCWGIDDDNLAGVVGVMTYRDGYTTLACCRNCTEQHGVEAAAEKAKLVLQRRGLVIYPDWAASTREPKC
jgi:hypothetical protein